MSNPQLHTLHPRGHGGNPYLSSGGVKGLSISVVFTTLATCFVLARLYTRARLMNRMEGNDWMIVIALTTNERNKTFSYVFMALFIVEALNGVGMHGADIPPHILIKQMKAFWVTIPFYNAALLCAKASILMQYFRVFPIQRMRRISWVMIGILATYGTWAVLSAFLNCIPVAKFWDPTIPGYCLSMKGLWFSNASMHIATDLAILIIPIPALAALDLPKRQKIALISIFALGGFVCVTSVCRLVALKKIADSDDPTYDNVDAATWSAIECNTGIICACLPTLRPLISHILPHLLSTLSHGGPAYVNRPPSRAQPPTYWHGTCTVSTTITAMEEDLEPGRCISPSAPADRILTLAPGMDASGKEKLMVKDAKGVEELKEISLIQYEVSK
ncbi:hypothetical protein EYZ11_004949 [Aspergillus tanneri]|uniref:Rhodopsin domain-containing protein n=1 Tax=Aspergillus tanneri TaxID=1220188 RepID=A0A4S3JLJ4_9EURO|nr:hypothetical protein EYZ11_004949 [Aspergillus tanneri]